MSSTLTDPPVVASVLVATAITIALFAIDRSWRASIPSIVVYLVAVAVALTRADVNTDRYLVNALDPYRSWEIAVLVAGAAAVLASAFAGRSEERSMVNSTVLLAAVSCSMFVYIPETDLLKLSPGPLAVVAAGVVVLGRPPIGPIGSSIVVSMLVWISLVDGATRPTTILATAAVLGIAALAPLVRPAEGDDDGTRRPPRRLQRVPLRWFLTVGALAACTVFTGRVLGTRTSWITSAISVAVVAATLATTVRLSLRER